MSTSLTVQTYIAACKHYGINIQGGVIHDFLRDSKVAYYGGKCPVYYVEYYHNGHGQRVVIGGNYATNGRPSLQPGEQLDFD